MTATTTANVVLPKTGYTAIQCNIIRETQKAVLIEIKTANGDKKECWLPLSQITYFRTKHFKQSNLDEDFTDVVHIADWLVAKQGLKD